MNILYEILKDCPINSKYIINTKYEIYLIQKLSSNAFKKGYNLNTSIYSFKHVFYGINNIISIKNFYNGKIIYPKIKRSNSF